MEPLDEEGRKQVDEVLEVWRQGDCVLGEHWFLFRTDARRPLTEDAVVAADATTDTAESIVFGLAVISQTCDVVRRCSERPFVEVCPLVEVARSVIQEVRRGRRPNYAFIPSLADRLLVADLDRVMTVEKSAVAGWERVEGSRTDGDARRLSLALARKRARTAFPDDFVAFAHPLVKRMSSKHDKDSDEGRALRSLREIRIRAAPSWDADEVHLTLWFVRDEDEPAFEGKGWEHYCEAWLGRVPSGGRFTRVEGVVQTLDDLTAREYVESDPLDLDYLSTRS